LTLPSRYPEKWVVDCKSVGSGEKALIYLGRYLYRGVIAEKDIAACGNGEVSFRYRNAKTGMSDGFRRAFPVAGAPACAAQWAPTRAQLWLPASELQVVDRFAALVAQVRSCPEDALAQEAFADSVPLLRSGDGYYQNPDSIRVLRPRPDSDSHRGGALSV
jgi:Putative transposase